MIVGVPKEIKKHEYRVGMTPSHAGMYVEKGHDVIIETSAGEGAGFSDKDYIKHGARILDDKKALFQQADMIVKVKEPLEEEYDLFHEGQILFTYLHLAANKKLTKALLAKKVVGIAYETIQLADGSLPCLTPMSEIAGRLSVQEGAKYLEKSFGGRGVLLGGVPGVQRGKVTIIGGGVVGTNAAKIAVGIGADVTILDLSAKRLGYLDDIFGSKLQTLYSNHENIIKCLKTADVVIGAVLVPGAKAPKLVTKKMLKHMQKGAVIVDVAVDQGGCFESTHATSHDEPTFNVEGVVHYCVANMPGAVALTSTQALTSVTLSYGLKIASEGWKKALDEDTALEKGLNMVGGKLCYEAVANSLGLPFQKYRTN
ncbi:MAG: alanine dehydrogenase [Lentisphaeraceae bacterium]|nr:alanine dehydrogenase [Lentisphaeraceae bacterium]